MHFFSKNGSASETWGEGHVRVTPNVIIFPSSVIQISNISSIAAIQRSWSAYIMSVILILSSVVISYNFAYSTSNVRVENLAWYFSSNYYWLLIPFFLLVMGVTIWPSYRFSLLVECNSGSVQVIIGKNRKFIMEAMLSIKKYMINQASGDTIINITANTVGDVVGRDKTIKSVERDTSNAVR